jgi:hypothetical protein
MPLPRNLTMTRQAEFAQKGLQHVYGNIRFGAPGANPPDAAEGKPFDVDGTDLVRTDTGDFVLTLPGSGAIRVLYCDFNIVDPTDMVDVQCLSFSESARTFTLLISDRETFGTPTDPTDNALLMVHIVLIGREDL